MSKITELKEISNRLAALIKELEGEENGENTTDFGVVATSELAGVEIADRDYTEDGKKYFTFDEACAIEGKLNNGWRLPTRHEWALICEDFGQKDGCLNAKTLMDNLGLEKLGWQNEDGEVFDIDRASYGYYWSSTPHIETTHAYYLNFNSSAVSPSYSNDRWLGFPVRLVRDIKEN